MENEKLLSADEQFWIDLFRNIFLEINELYIQKVLVSIWDQHRGDNQDRRHYKFIIIYKNEIEPVQEQSFFDIDKAQDEEIRDREIDLCNYREHSILIPPFYSSKSYTNEIRSMINWMKKITLHKSDSSLFNKLCHLEAYFQAFLKIDARIESAQNSKKEIFRHLSNNEFIHNYGQITNLKSGKDDFHLFKGIYVEFERLYCCGDEFDQIIDQSFGDFKNYDVLFGSIPYSKNFRSDLERALESFIRFKNGRELGTDFLKKLDQNEI
jgi:hypothetical protein